MAKKKAVAKASEVIFQVAIDGAGNPYVCGLKFPEGFPGYMLPRVGVLAEVDGDGEVTASLVPVDSGEVGNLSVLVLGVGEDLTGVVPVTSINEFNLVVEADWEGLVVPETEDTDLSEIDDSESDEIEEEEIDTESDSDDLESEELESEELESDDLDSDESGFEDDPEEEELDSETDSDLESDEEEEAIELSDEEIEKIVKQIKSAKKPETLIKIANEFDIPIKKTMKLAAMRLRLLEEFDPSEED